MRNAHRMQRALELLLPEGQEAVQFARTAGDTVLFGKWSGTEVKIDGQDLLIMKESDVMGVITGVPAAKKKAA